MNDKEKRGWASGGHANTTTTAADQRYKQEKPPKRAKRVWIENDPPTSESPLVVTKIDESHKARFTEYVIAPAGVWDEAIRIVSSLGTYQRTAHEIGAASFQRDVIIALEVARDAALEPKGTKP